MRPPPYPKKIELKERLFFHYKINASNYSLFDSTMSTPVIYGSSNLVAATIKNLPTDSVIFYFEADEGDGWKMKKAYKPSLKTATTKEKTASIKEKI